LHWFALQTVCICAFVFPALRHDGSIIAQPGTRRRDTNRDTAAAASRVQSLHLPFGWSRIDIMRKTRGVVVADY